MGGGSGSGRGAPVHASATMDTVGGLGRLAMNREEERLTRNDSFDTLSTSATTNSEASTYDGVGSVGVIGSKPSSSSRRRTRRQPPPPRGLLNLGNTCYANAALQCLFATALPHALLDQKKAAVFRRYASNGNLLALGSGSADSQDEDEDNIGGSGDDAGSSVGLMLDEDQTSEQKVATEERRKRREERKKRREARLREEEKRAQRELCKWLTGEMTELTRNYTAAARKVAEPVESGFFGSLFGSSNSSSIPPIDAVDPGSITRNVHKLCRTLQPYQQEDAHEFLRALLSGLVMDGQNRKLSALFDGLLESAVTCQTCRYTSLTRDRYMDLSLDIADKSVTDLPQALRNFTRTEMLDEDNMVECGRCKEKRVVSKGLRLATAPTVLVVQLKRFAFDMYGRMTRLNNDVKYPLRLEIGEYMSKANRATPPPYELVGLLVHSGRTCDSGHYLSYVKSGEKWYKANDSVVSEVTEEVALNQKPYILVYEVAGIKARHGCDTYHRYHRKANADADERSASRRGRATARDDSAQSSSSLRSNGARAQSAPRAGRHDKDGGRSTAPAHERGGSDDLNAKTAQSGEVAPENSSDCSAFSSLFGLLELCGGGTAQVADEDGGDQQEYQEGFSTRSPSVQSSGTSRNLEGLASDGAPDAAGSSAPQNKDVIGSMPPPTSSSPPLSQRKGSAPSPSSPGSARRLQRSASSGSARDLELNAARAYRKNLSHRKRASMAPEVERLTSTTEKAGEGDSSQRSGWSVSSSDGDASSASGAATEILAGKEEKGHHHRRRIKSLSRFARRAANKTTGAVLHHSVAVTSSSASSPRGRMLGGATHQQRRTTPAVRGKSKSRPRGSEGELPPLPTGK